MTALKTPQKKIIIDSDLGWDDVLSILYLMKDPQIRILGLTITGCGETNFRWGGVIAKTLMDLGQQTQAAVCMGADVPLAGGHVFPQDFKSDMNDIMGLLGSLNPCTDTPIDPRSAWELMAQTLETEKITLLSLGGFTNLATLLARYPHAKLGNIEQVVAMAGAVFVDGNIAALNNAKPEWDQGPIYANNHAAEWNVFVDPLAAQQVFQSHIPLTLVPLDACNAVTLTPDFANQITAQDPLAMLAKNVLLEKSGGHAEGSLSVPIFDPLATLVMTGVLKNIQVDHHYLDVVLQDTVYNNLCGKTSPVQHGSRKIKVVRGVSQHEFAMQYATLLNQELCSAPSP